MESYDKNFIRVIVIVMAIVLSIIYQLTGVRVHLGDYLLLAIGFRIILLFIYTFILTNMLINYLRTRGSVIRFLLLSITFYFISFLLELFYLIAINSEVSDSYLIIFLFALYTSIGLGGLSFIIFVVRISDPKRSTRILWLPILYLGIILSYFVDAPTGLGLRVFNHSVSYYQIQVNFPLFISLMNLMNYFYIGSYCLIQIILRRKMGSQYVWQRYITTIGIIGTYFGIAIPYTIGYLQPPDSFLKYIILDFITPGYILLFTALVYVPYITDMELVKFFALGVEHFYIVGPDGLPYLTINFNKDHTMSDEMLVSAAISAIQSIMYDMGMGFSPLRKIELEERKILFYASKEYIYCLVTSEVTSYLEEQILDIGMELDQILRDLPKEMIMMDERIERTVRRTFGKEGES